jgi:hypothetical protein
MPHPNLSPELNMMADYDEGFDINNLGLDEFIMVATENSEYMIRYMGGGFEIKGGRFPDYVPAIIHGSTFGGSCIKTQFIGLGMRLEFSYVTGELGECRDKAMWKTLITSTIREIAKGRDL